MLHYYFGLLSESDWYTANNSYAAEMQQEVCVKPREKYMCMLMTWTNVSGVEYKHHLRSGIVDNAPSGALTAIADNLTGKYEADVY